MKLIIEATSKNSMGAVHDLVNEQGFVIARCGTIEDAQEIVRRVNAHDAMVTALRRMISVNYDRDHIPSCASAIKEAKAALALAEKGEL